MILRFVLILTIASYAITSLAKGTMDNVVRILEASSSGKTIAVAEGLLDDVYEGDEGEFFYQEGTTRAPKLRFVARGKVIKANSKYSLWHLDKVIDRSRITRDNRLHLYQSRDVLRGRKPYKILQRKVIPDSDTNKITFLREQENGVPGTLIKREQGYVPGKLLVKTANTPSYDIRRVKFEDVDFSSPKYVQDYLTELETRYVSELEDVADSQEIRDAKESSVVAELVGGTANKVNNLEGGLDELYVEQEKDPDLGVVNEKLSNDSVFDNFQKSRQSFGFVSPRVIERIRKEGPTWSAGMTDLELRNYVIATGLINEYRRQNYAFTNEVANEITLRFSSQIAQATTPEDQSNQGVSYNISLGYELDLLRISEAYRSYSLELSFARGLNYFDGGVGENVKANESSFMIGGNYYLIRYPSTIGKVMLYIGGGVRYGTAVVFNDRTSKRYGYGFVSLPTGHIGLKYRFPSTSYGSKSIFGIGLNFRVGIENKRFSANEELQDNNLLPTITASDLNMGFGLSGYF